MKTYHKHIILATLVFISSLPLFAQWNSQSLNVRFSIPEVAMVDLESDASFVEFEIEASSEPGGEPTIRKRTNNNIWINYTSAIRQSGNKRSINVEISEGFAPAGTAFYIEASQASAFGSVNQGISAGKVQVQKNPRPIITDIGSCYTGDGVNNGHELRYYFEITDFNKLQSAVTQVFTVMYTITDN